MYHKIVPTAIRCLSDINRFTGYGIAADELISPIFGTRENKHCSATSTGKTRLPETSQSYCLQSSVIIQVNKTNVVVI